MDPTPWSLIFPLQLVVVNGFAHEVRPALLASSSLAHDRDILAALLGATAALAVPRPRRLRFPGSTPPSTSVITAIAPLLHAAAALGHEGRVRELLAVGGGDAGLLMRCDAAGRTPIMAAAQAAQPAALAALLSDARATREVVAFGGVDVREADGIGRCAFVLACGAAQRRSHLNPNATYTGIQAALAARQLGLELDALPEFVEREDARVRAAASCARLLWDTGFVDPGAHCGGGSELEASASTPARAATIRGARPTLLAWAAKSGVLVGALLPDMLADARCTADAFTHTWDMTRPSAFWSVVEAFGVVDDSGDWGEPRASRRLRPPKAQSTHDRSNHTTAPTLR
jgi:hypothetical protein